MAVLVCGQVENGEVKLDAVEPLSVEVGLIKQAILLPGPFDEE